MLFKNSNELFCLYVAIIFFLIYHEYGCEGELIMDIHYYHCNIHTDVDLTGNEPLTMHLVIILL